MAGAGVIDDPVARVVPRSRPGGGEEASVGRGPVAGGADRRERGIVEPQSVDAGGEVGDGVDVARTWRGGEVEEVRPASASDRVVTAAGAQRVIRAIAKDDVGCAVAAAVERADPQCEVFEAGPESPRDARDHGIVAAGIGQHVAGGDVIRVIACLPVHRVGASATVEGVVAGSAAQAVVAAGAGYELTAGRAA